MGATVAMPVGVARGVLVGGLNVGLTLTLLLVMVGRARLAAWLGGGMRAKVTSAASSSSALRPLNSTRWRGLEARGRGTVGLGWVVPLPRSITPVALQ